MSSTPKSWAHATSTDILDLALILINVIKVRENETIKKLTKFLRRVWIRNHWVNVLTYTKAFWQLMYDKQLMYPKFAEDVVSDCAIEADFSEDASMGNRHSLRRIIVCMRCSECGKGCY